MRHLTKATAKFHKRKTLSMDLRQRVKKSTLTNSFRPFRDSPRIPNTKGKKKRDYFRSS